MSSRYQYTTMDRVFSKIDRDITSDFNEDDVIEWTGEALEFMRCVKSYEEVVCFAEVKNFHCAVPKWCHAIIQIGRDSNIHCSQDVWAFTKTVKEILPTNIVLTDDGEYVTVGNSMQLANQVVLNVNYKVWLETPYYRQRYTPVRLATSTLFNSLVCDDGCDYSSCRDEYQIVMGNTIRFSFETGIVIIPFLKQAVQEETGWPLVPDHISFLTAITKYVNMKMVEKEYNAGREGAKGRLDKYEADWQWYCKQAGNVDMMPFGVDEHQNLLNQRSYLLPPQNRYYGFFGNLNKPENRSFLNPRGNRIYGY